MNFAIIETGGKQYIVSPKNRIKVEKLTGEDGGQIKFDKVLLMSSEKELKIGKPYITDAAVTGKILKQGRGEKLKWIKYRAKSRYRRHKGHRQDFTEVEIESLA